MTATTVSPHPDLDHLIVGVRDTIAAHADWARTATLVAAQLEQHLPAPDVLAPDQRKGSPDRATSHLLHSEPDGSFSILGLVWLPGQTTRIHDHTTWCAFGVIQGIEHEELFDEHLNPVGVNDNRAGDVNGFAPPGDIHRIRNASEIIAISLHIYGTDITRIGSTVRRYYD